MTRTLVLFLLFGCSIFSVPQDRSLPKAIDQSQDWKEYGSEGGRKFSSLNKINSKNVKFLELAWSYETGEENKGFQATPLVIEGIMYICSSKNKVIALNAKSGQIVWQYKPLHGHQPFNNICRGVSYWRSHENKKQTCSERIITNTITGKLIALDSKTGGVCKDFGKKGIVDLYKGMGTNLPIGKREIFWTSAPLIHGDQIVVGGGILDNSRLNAPSGVIRSFDVSTGSLNWAWNPTSKEIIDNFLETRNEKTGQYVRGTPNSWAPMTSDVSNDLIFIPMGNASPDFFGGLRHNQDYAKYSSSVVALTGKGKLKWSYQTVEKDLWDYDIASQPTLATMEIEGKLRDVVFIGTKMGHIFVLDRLSGKEIFKTEKKMVSTFSVKEETPAAFQKFPTFPKPLYLNRNGNYSDQKKIPDWWLKKLNKINPEFGANCQKLYASYKNKGIFFPPSVEGVIQIPGILGGLTWSGISVDQEKGMIYANINRKPLGIRLVPRNQCKKPERTNWGRVSAIVGAPYCVEAHLLEAHDNAMNFSNYSCFPPPYGEVVAIDIKNKKIKWRKPIGIQNGQRGSISLGGILSTKGGVSFLASTKDKKIRAIESETGKIIWSYPLEDIGAATPMTYMIENKQYISIAIGGHHYLDYYSKPIMNKIMTFSLESKLDSTY